MALAYREARMHHKYTPEFLARFWSRVDRKDDLDACWNWIGAVNHNYGQIWWNGKHRLAHRISYELAYSEPAELDVLHTCDNPRCVNPRHLWLGTQRDNNLDRDRKNRGVHLRGERHGNCKLSDAQVAEIRRIYATGDTSQRELARMFHISQRQIWCIVNRKNRL